MFHFSEQFHDQYTRFHQQYFEQWTAFEQFYAILESSKKLELPHRYFLSQFLLDVNIKQERNDMFNHTVHQANTPAILVCLMSEPLDKIILTLQLYLPLLSLTSNNEKLLDAYREVLIYLDSKLDNFANFTYNKQQLIQYCQQIRYFIQNNPSLQKFVNVIPQIKALSMCSTGLNHSNILEENISITQRHQQALQRYPSVRSYATASTALMNLPSEGSTSSSSFAQQLMRKDASDSGVDLTETGINNSVQSLLSQSLANRQVLNLSAGQETTPNRPYVSKTSSSPIPEQNIANNRSTPVPLSAVLSAPIPSKNAFYSDYRPNNTNYGQNQLKAPLTISDEDEQESQLQGNYHETITARPLEFFLSDMNPADTNKRLTQFRSLRNRNSRMYGQARNNYNDSVSPYLAVDSNTDSVRNTFIQPNSGMRDVPKWLKNLRLHKYAFFFSQMTYDQMMNLTMEQLKEGKITDGACTKILINIKKLKERGANLKKLLADLDHEQIDLKNILQQLHELMLTPIRAKQSNEDNENEEDLPQLIMQVLDKVNQLLTMNMSSTTILSDMCNNLVGLFDRCYKHEAFSSAQRLTLLQWRGPLCTKLQSSGKIEFKSMQSSSSSTSMNRRTQLKPQISMGVSSNNTNNKPAVRNIKSNAPYYPTYSSNPIPLVRQHNSETSNNNDTASTLPIKASDSNIIRRPNKSPTFIFTSNADVNKDENNQHMSLVASQSLQEPTSHHHQQQQQQHQQQQQGSGAFLVERSGFGTGSLRPSFNYLTSTPQRSNSAYLAANHHQLLSRKTSIDPYGDEQNLDKTKLCKTFSDPNRIRFQNSTLSGQNSSNYGNLNTSYSSQRSYLNHSTVEQNNASDGSNSKESSMQQNYSDTETSVFYGNDEVPNNPMVNQTTEENRSHDQRHNSTEFETFYRQITASALGDDGQDSSMDSHIDYSDAPTKQSSSSSSTDVEQ